MHKTEHFALMDPPDSPRADHMHSFGESCESMYGQLSSMLQINTPEPIWVYRFVTSEDCEKKTGHPPGYVDGNRIYTRIGAPIGGAIALAALESSTPGHRSFEFVRNGLRMAFDNQTSNVHRDASLLRADERWIGLEDLVAMSSATIPDPEVYNTESASFIAYLIQRHGMQRFKTLWSSTAGLKDALQKIYGGSLAQIEEDWIAHLEREANRT
jgi:hypothetical protein